MTKKQQASIHPSDRSELNGCDYAQYAQKSDRDTHVQRVVRVLGVVLGDALRGGAKGRRRRQLHVHYGPKFALDVHVLALELS